MKPHALRLTFGDDLMASIEAYVKAHNIRAGVILSGVGCLTRAAVRDAGGVKIKTLHQNVEIVSVTGTLSPDGCHIHIALSDEDLQTYGGHLVHGCLVNTTAELVLLELPEFSFTRAPDARTGYDELVITSPSSDAE